MTTDDKSRAAFYEWFDDYCARNDHPPERSVVWQAALAYASAAQPDEARELLVRYHVWLHNRQPFSVSSEQAALDVDAFLASQQEKRE